MLNGTTLLIHMLLSIPAMLIATTLHEFIRALVATIQGDPTPKNQGRLTLNPLKHFEPLGLILLYYYKIGWGQPVITDPRRFSNRRSGVILTNTMPSVFNFLMALFFNYASKLVPDKNSLIAAFFALTVHYNLVLIVCNLIPVPPFDCAKIWTEFAPKSTQFSYAQNEKILQLILILFLLMGFVSPIITPLVGVLSNFIEFLTITQ